MSDKPMSPELLLLLEYVKLANEELQDAYKRNCLNNSIPILHIQMALRTLDMAANEIDRLTQED
jgi:hypothetical protein